MFLAQGYNAYSSKQRQTQLSIDHKNKILLQPLPVIHICPMRKHVFLVSDQFRHKPSCTATEDGWRYHLRGVFRNNVDYFNNFTMLCSMVIKIISMCFLIFLPYFRRVWFSSDDFVQSYRLSKRVTNMNPGHVKGVHHVNEVDIFG